MPQRRTASAAGVNVAELRVILEHVPDNLPVIISGAGVGAWHIRFVRNGATGRGHFADGSPWPPALRLDAMANFGGGVLWCKPEPPYEMGGRWRRQVELRAKLDALEGTPA